MSGAEKSAPSFCSDVVVGISYMLVWLVPAGKGKSQKSTTVNPYYYMLLYSCKEKQRTRKETAKMIVVGALLNNSDEGVSFSDPMELSSLDDLLDEVMEDTQVWEKIRDKDYTVEEDDDGRIIVWIDIRDVEV